MAIMEHIHDILELPHLIRSHYRSVIKLCEYQLSYVYSKFHLNIEAFSKEFRVTDQLLYSIFGNSDNYYVSSTKSFINRSTMIDIGICMKHRIGCSQQFIIILRHKYFLTLICKSSYRY